MSEQVSTDRREKALALHEEGLTIVPAHPIEKRPLIDWARFQHQDVTDDLIGLWTSSARWKDCNWAIVTGKEVVVVDADSAEATAWAEANLPHTPRRVRTSRGVHFYYRADKDLPIKNSADGNNKIDIRGQGGVVIAAGSRHETGHIYEEIIDAGVDGDWRLLPSLTEEHVARIHALNKPNLNLLRPQNGGWHDKMIREVAAMIGNGLSDDEIIMVSRGWTEPGYSHEQTAAEFMVAVNGARIKGFAPEGAPADPGPSAEILAVLAARREALAPRPLNFGNILQLPPRDWVYGRHLIRKFISVTVAAGGTGKTALTLAEAMAMATGRPLLGQETKKLRVWVWNLEDPLEELQRRFAAICQLYQVAPEEYEGSLFVNSGRDSALVIAETQRGEAVLTPAVAAVTDYIKQHEIDVVVVDPFVSSHRLNENDNAAIDLVVKAWGRVADQGNCAVELVHHVRKAQPGQSASYGDARGASALTDAARHVRRLTSMTNDEARYAGIDERERWRYSKEGDSKDNLAPPRGDGSWRQMVSVDLPNGDNVGVVEPWAWPDPFDDVTSSDLRRVQAKLKPATWRENSRATDWVGILVADVLDLDDTDPTDREKIKTIVRRWVRAKALVIVDRVDPSDRHTRAFIECGELHEAINI